MNKPTLVILAAGMASRYGSMKQVEGFGPGGETIMDYSIFDALRAGFGKIVFIIRRDFADNFKKIFDKKLAGKADVEYVFQELPAFTNDFEIPKERSKPWGTAHALLCAREAVNEPFAVINADDFYGRDAFKKAVGFLDKECREGLYSIIGYKLENTLSEFGSVSRGVCKVDDHGFLVGINERTNIYRTDSGIVFEENEMKNEISGDSIVSMNFWCFHPSVFGWAEKMFNEFLLQHGKNPKAEFFIPILADDFIRNSHGKIKVISTSAPWFGVTYKEDAPGVGKSLNGLVAKKEYPERLWAAENT